MESRIISRLAACRRATLFASLAVTIFTLSLQSCTKTVVETHDVIKEIKVHDTTNTVTPIGPAWVRFISMMPVTGSVVVYRDAHGSPIATATSNTGNSYIPLRPDTSSTYYMDYYVDGNHYFDSITLPSLHPGSISTVALFFYGGSSDHSLSYWLGDDSLKAVAGKPGFAHVRFINGLLDFPTPSPLLYLDLDTVGKPLCDTIGSVQGGTLTTTYLDIPAGNHTLYIRADAETKVYERSWQFVEGQFYTARVYGRRTNSTDGFAIDAE